mgnify:CR=1 FL=1
MNRCPDSASFSRALGGRAPLQQFQLLSVRSPEERDVDIHFVQVERLLVDELGLSAGQVFGILRVAVTGQRVSPPLFESMEIVGLSKVLERVQKAIELLSAIS